MKKAEYEEKTRQKWGVEGTGMGLERGGRGDGKDGGGGVWDRE